MTRRILAGAILVLVLALGLAPARGQSMFDHCEIQAGTDWITVPPREPAHDRPVTVIQPKSLKEPVELKCPLSGKGIEQRDPAAKNGLGRGFYLYHYKIDAPGARHEPSIGQPTAEHVYIPVQSGANKVTVTVRRPAMAGFPAFSATEVVSFTAWLFQSEPAGKLEMPGGAFNRQSTIIEPQMTDADGNLYLLTRRMQQGGQGTATLTRHAPDGHIVTRYQIGPNGVGPDSSGPRALLGLDSDGNAYVVIGGNFVRFDRNGAFLGTIAPFSHMTPADSPADLVDWMKRMRPETDGPLAAVNSLADWGGYAPLFGDGGFYLFAVDLRDEAPGKSPTAGIKFGRLGLDGTFTPVADFGEYGKFTPWGAVPGPDGNFYVAFPTADNKYGLLSLDRTGKVLNRVIGNGGGIFGAQIGGFDAQGGAYLRYGDGCQRILFDDLKGARPDSKLRQQGGTLLGSELLNQRWQIFGSAIYAAKYRDLATGALLNAGKDTDMPQRLACWVSHGSVYALWDDMTIGKYTFAEGAITTTARPAAAPATARLKLERAGGSFDDAVSLDGQTPVDIVATVTGANGAPLAGVPVELTFASSDLRDPGEVTLVSPTTDRDGHVRGHWIAPKLRAEELVSTLSTAAITLNAVARPSAAPPVEASVNLRGLALSPFALRIRRPGVVWDETPPIDLAERQERVIQGTVLLNLEPGSGMFDARYAALVKPQPLGGATVELLDDTQRPVATATTDATGAFTLTYTPPADRAVKGSALPPLAAPFAGGRLAPEIEDLLKRATATFAVLEAAPYNYDVARLQRTLAADFPRRFAAAATDQAITREIDLADRIAELAVVARVAQQFADDAIDKFAQSSTAIMDGFIQIAVDGDIIDAVAFHGASGTAVAQLGRSASAALVKQRLNLSIEKAVAVTMFQRARGYVLKELVSKLGTEAGKEAVKSFYENTVWSITRQVLNKIIGDRLDWVGDDWRAQGEKPYKDEFHKNAQSELTRAGERWAADRIPWQGKLGPALATISRDFSATRDEAIAHQYNLDLYKADFDLAFSSVGNGIKIGAALFGSPVAGKLADDGIGGLETFYRMAAAGCDAYVGFEWLAQYELARTKLGEFARLAIGAPEG